MQSLPNNLKSSIHDVMLVLVPEVTTPSWEEGCFLEGKDYTLLSNLVQLEEVEHAMQCQKLCQLALGCQHFTFHWRGGTLGNCYLKGNLGLASLLDAASSISGPKFC